MGKHLNKNGFTMLELLIVMFVVTTLIFILDVNFIEHNRYYFNPTHCQLKAMSTKSTCSFWKGLSYNSNGNINQGKTILVNNKKCVFQLGMGRYYCE